MTSHRDTLLEVKEALKRARIGTTLIESKDRTNRLNCDNARDAIAYALKLVTALLEAPPADRVERHYAPQAVGRFLDLLEAGLRFIGLTVQYPDHCPGEIRISNGIRHTQMKLPALEPARGGDADAQVDIEAGARAIDPSAFGLGLVNNVSLTMQHIARSHAKACATAWGLTYVD
jgi:hypothetical protein